MDERYLNQQRIRAIGVVTPPPNPVGFGDCWKRQRGDKSGRAVGYATKPSDGQSYLRILPDGSTEIVSLRKPRKTRAPKQPRQTHSPSAATLKNPNYREQSRAEIDRKLMEKIDNASQYN